jgi:putative endopeptidase
MDVFWNVDIQIDPGNPKTNIITLGQGGLSLPDATLYLDPESDTVRQQYLAHITKMFKLIGSSDAQAAQAAQDVLTLETMIAKVTALPDELTDPFTTYNKVSYTNFKSIIAPGINWDVYFADVGIVNPQALNLDVPHFYGNISVIIQNSQDMWSSYLKWNVVHATASLLTKEIVDEDFAFFSKILRGINQQPSRNRTCVRSTDAYLGELLGVQFAERSFAGDSKKTAQDMIDAIEAAFGSNLKGLNWMDDDTRAKAQLKLSKVYNMIGYPDVPTNYTFPVNPDTFAENVIIARAWKFQRTMATLNMPSDRKKWDMTPATVNAYYDPTRNIMVFPAGIMQTPYFNLTFPLPLRFGGAGMIMGHEVRCSYWTLYKLLSTYFL